MMAHSMSAVLLMILCTSASASASCDPSSGTCAAKEGPRAGAAMLQTGRKAETVPMKATVSVLEKDMAMVSAKVIKLETAVGMPPRSLLQTGQEPAAEEAAAAEPAAAADPVEADAPTGSMKARVVALETDEKDMRSRLTSLENTVRGRGGNVVAFVRSHTVETVDADDLEGRVAQLKGSVEDLKTRVASLEQAVTGLQVGTIGEATAASLENDDIHKRVPLKAIVTVLEKDMTQVKTDVAALEATVGATAGAAPATEAAPAVEEAAAEAEALLEVNQEPTTLTARVQALEADAADMSSRITSLENVVRGQGGAIALIAKSTVRTAAGQPQLNYRVAALEATTDELKARVASLQQAVAGLQVGGQALMGSKKEKIPMTATVEVLEKDMATVKVNVAALETVVGMEARPAGEAAPAVEEAAALFDAGQAPASTLKERVTALESDSTDMLSRVSSLENVVRGQGGNVALISKAQTTGHVRDDHLVGRVATLKTQVDDLKGRVSTLQHAVTGLQAGATSALQKSHKDKKGVPMVATVTVLEKDMATIKANTQTLETTVGMNSRPAAALLDTTQAPALKARVTALETDSTDMLSRVTSLETVVRGKGGELALISKAQTAGHKRADHLESRVATVKVQVDDLKVRVTKLQHVVTGLQLDK